MHEAVADAVRTALAELGEECEWRERDERTFSVTLPGERKLKTECAVVIGQHGLEVRAFVARHPDENEAGVYAWLLQRNLKLRSVAFALDHLGDVHLIGCLPLDAVTPEALDALLGELQQTSDASFNTILELGFASSIRKEWQWRLDRGEPTGNLTAFEHLRPQ